MNQNNNSTYDHDSDDSTPRAARVPDGDVIERQNQVIKSLYEQIDKHQERADAERARSALWQAATADLIDQNAELVKRADHAEASRGEWQRTAEGLEQRASIPTPPTPDQVALHQFALAHLTPAHPVRLRAPFTISFPHRFEIPVGVVGYLHHKHGTDPLDGGAVVVEIPVSHVPGLKVDGVRAIYPRIPLGSLGLHEDWSTRPQSPTAPWGLPNDVALKLNDILDAHGLNCLVDVLRVLLGRYEETEDSARIDGAAAGQDRWACLCGLAGCGAPLNHDALCPACLELVTHRGEEGGEGAAWGRCVECKADRHVWRVHTAADPSGSLVCGHCMALDLAHKVNHPEQTVTVTNDVTITAGQASAAELAAAAAEAHLDDLAGGMGY